MTQPEAPEAPPAPAENPPASTPAPSPAPESKGEARFSWDDALKEAQAATKAADPAPEAKAPPASDPAATVPASSPEAPSSGNRTPEEGALTRALNLRRQGRESELSAKAVALLDDYDTGIKANARTEFEQERATEDNLRRTYLSLESARIDDEEAFNRDLAANPEKAVFYRSYAQAHPDVSLENPTAKRQRSEQEIGAEFNRIYGQGFERALNAIAADAGLSDESFSKLKADFKFDGHPDSAKLGTFLGKMVSAVADAASKDSKAKLKDQTEELTALRTENSVLKGSRIQAPSHVSSSGSAGTAGRADEKTSAGRMANSMEEARQQLSAAGIHQ